MIEYIPPLNKKKFKYPRKKKKELIKLMGRNSYYELTNEDGWRPDGILARFFEELYEKEMLERRQQLRELKLKRILEDGNI